MARVRTHTFTRDGQTYTRQQHDRNVGGQGPRMWTLQPRRAWRNAKRTRWALKGHRNWAAAAWGTAAVAEILAFTTLRAVGSVLFVAGAVGLAVGYGMWRT